MVNLTKAPKGAVNLPLVHRITVPFTWESVEYLVSLDSSDFPDEGLRSEYNRRDKRSDYRYPELLEDIREGGYLDPVFVFGPGELWSAEGEALGNGHHRVVAAFDLGYTHIPVTRDRNHQWRSSGMSAR